MSADPTASAAAIASDVPPISRRALWACVVPALILPALGSLLYSYVFIGTPVGKAVMVVTKVFTLTWPLIAVMWIEKQRRVVQNWRDPAHWRAIPLGLYTGLAIFVATAVLWQASPVGEYVRQHSDAIARQTRALGFAESVATYVVLTTLLSVVHSALEEYYWRWYVYGRLTRLVSPGWAHGIAGVGFALHHFVILSKYFPPLATLIFGVLVGVGGVIWSWQMTRQRSLVGCWISHMLVDAILMIIGYQLVFGA